MFSPTGRDEADALAGRGGLTAISRRVLGHGRRNVVALLRQGRVIGFSRALALESNQGVRVTGLGRHRGHEHEVVRDARTQNARR